MEIGLSLSLTNTSLWQQGGAALVDSDVQSFFVRNASAGQSLSDPQKAAYSDFVATLKTALIWDLLNRIEVQFARAPLKIGNGDTAISSGTLTNSDRDDLEGLVLNAAGYADTGLPANTFTIDNVHVFVYGVAFGTATDTNASAFGAASASSNNILMLQTRASVPIVRGFCNATPANWVNGTVTRGVAAYCLNSDSSTSLKLFTNGVQTGVETGSRSGPLTSNTIYLGAYNIDGAAAIPDAGAIRVCTFGESLTSDQQLSLLQAVRDLDFAWRATFEFGYLVSSFEATTSEVLALWDSIDGITLSPRAVTYTPNEGTVRDPSIYKDAEGVLWLAHTAYGFDGGTVFLVAKSVDNGRTFQHVATVSMAAITDVAFVWSPEWFVDPDDDSLHIVISASDGDITGPFQLYEVHPTNAGMTTWSVPVHLEVPTRGNTIDPFVTFHSDSGGVYRLWFKNEDTDLIETATASALLGPYTLESSGDWAGWGSNVEGFCITITEDGYRAYMDRYAADTGLAYSESANLTGASSGTWTALTNVSSPTHTRHGTVLQLA